MRLTDVLWLSFKDLKEKKVRTGLTILMVMIGVAAIVALTSQTAGISASIKNELSALGPTSIIIEPSGGTVLTSADVGILSSLPNASQVIPAIIGAGTVYANGKNASITIIGGSAEGITQFLGGNVSLYQGTMYSDTVNPEAVVGHSVAFPSSTSGAQNIKVGYPIAVKIASGRTSETVTIPVVGIMDSYGSSVIPTDTSIFVSLQAAEILLHKTSYSVIIVKASNTSSVTALTSLITTIYGSKAQIITTQQLLQTTASIIGSISILFAIIAGVSLLVAAVGIMNIMLIAVFERTHEIGIMKSVGFRSKDILTIFMLQALIIGFLGGVVGIAVGATASFGVAAVFAHSSSAAPSNSTSGPPSGSGGGATYRSGGGGGAAASSSGSGLGSGGLSYSPVFTPSTLISAILVAMIVSMIAGIYPAWRASKMEPIDALREL